MAGNTGNDLREPLRDFVQGLDQEKAFATVAERVSGLIYHTALRRCGNRTVAEEVVQKVLLQLSRKAAKLIDHPALLAWVHEASRLETSKHLRGERRRQRREEKAMEKGTEEQPADPLILSDLDESMRVLKAGERELVLMRFFEGRTFAAIADHTGRSPSAEKMRLKRALEKMAAWFGRKGTILSVAGLTTVLSTELARAVPAGLVTSSGLLGTSSSSTASLPVALASALLVTAMVAGPLRSEWQEWKELERESLARSRAATLSSRNPGGRGDGGPRLARRVADWSSISEKWPLDEIAERLLRNENQGDAFEAKVLRRQLENLTTAELKSLSQRITTPRRRFCSETTELVGRELEARIGWPATMDFLLASSARVSAIGELFRSWCQESGLEVAGQWLRQAQSDGRLEVESSFFDYARRLWYVYLGLLSAQDLPGAVALFERLDLDDDQKCEIIQAFWRHTAGQTSHFLEPLKTSEGRLQKAWAEVFWRSLTRAERENWKEVVDRYSFGEELAGQLFRKSFETALFNRRTFRERLAWLEENVPRDKWRELFVKSSAPETSSANRVNPYLIREMSDFPEQFEAMPEGPDKDLFRLLKAEELCSRIVTRGEDLQQTLLETLKRMSSEADQQIIIHSWLRSTKWRNPEAESEVRKALEQAGFQVEGGSR